MRIINKKYLLIILLVGVIITGVIMFKPKENVKLDNVILKQEVNNKTFAMYKEDGENNYVKVEDDKFPDMYVLNLTKSKCIDNNGNELDEVLSYENDKVTITSGNTTYCYLYFDKSLGLEIKEKEPNKLSTDKVRGAMYRFQGQQDENVNNYICFGTNDQSQCTSAPDKYMYRIIGIEAETGRVKVIKKEALEQKYQWYTDKDTDIEFPDSKIYEAINGASFLENPTYVPAGWGEKIANNTWMYGDMQSSSTIGVNQIGEDLYLAETGQKGTIWDAKAEKEDPGALSYVVQNGSYEGETFYYIRHENEKWAKTFPSKISLMYLHDYYLSVSDKINCGEKYTECKMGWMHLSQNDSESSNEAEWTMSRNGWYVSNGWFRGRYLNDKGSFASESLDISYFVRPVFYLASVNEFVGGSGTSDDPFIIK